LTHEDRLVAKPFENGNEAVSRLSVNLEFQKLRAYLHLLGFACSRSVARSVHLLCNVIVNSSCMANYVIKQGT